MSTTATTARNGPADPAFRVRRIGGTLGAEVTGLDVSRPLSEVVRRGLDDAFIAHKVLAFRDQQLDKAQLMAFSRLWGPVTPHLRTGYGQDDTPEVGVSTNASPDGRPNGRHTDETAKRWHTDRSFMPSPAVATLFYGVTVPESGGDTLFADTVAAYEALPAATRTRIDPLIAVHWYGHTRDPANGGGFPATAAELAAAPPVRHRLARPHAVTGRKAIYCGCHAWKIDGWTPEDSKPLFDELVAHATQDRFVYRHKWRPGDLVMWDNRATLHAATDFDGRKELRVMYRTAIDQAAPDMA